MHILLILPRAPICDQSIREEGGGCKKSSISYLALWLRGGRVCVCKQKTIYTRAYGQEHTTTTTIGISGNIAGRSLPAREERIPLTLRARCNGSLRPPIRDFPHTETREWRVANDFLAAIVTSLNPLYFVVVAVRRRRCWCVLTCYCAVAREYKQKGTICVYTLYTQTRYSRASEGAKNYYVQCRR